MVEAKGWRADSDEGAVLVSDGSAQEAMRFGTALQFK